MQNVSKLPDAQILSPKFKLGNLLRVMRNSGHSSRLLYYIRNILIYQVSTKKTYCRLSYSASTEYIVTKIIDFFTNIVHTPHSKLYVHILIIGEIREIY